jgi:DNA polymerase-3 subunit alpha
MSSDEIHDFMDDKVGRDIVNMAFANTNEINRKITSYDLAKPQKVPHLSDDRKYCSQWKETFNHMKARNKFEYINKYLTSSSEDDNYLIYLGLMNLKKMNLPNEKYEMYMNRLEQELTECWLVSERLGQPISSYLLMVRNIIQIMWNEADSLVGISRGSAGVMLINYLIGVTQMNPLEQGIYLPHWRSA